MDLKINELIDYSDGGILSKVIVKNEKLDVTLFCMAKQTEMSEHTSTKQGLIYVVEGNGIFTLEGKEIRMLPGTTIHMNEHAVHSLRATDDTSFLLVLVSNR